MSGAPVPGVVNVHRVIIPVDRPKSSASRGWGTPKKKLPTACKLTNLNIHCSPENRTFGELQALLGTIMHNLHFLDNIPYIYLCIPSSTIYIVSIASKMIHEPRIPPRAPIRIRMHAASFRPIPTLEWRRRRRRACIATSMKVCMLHKVWPSHVWHQTAVTTSQTDECSVTEYRFSLLLLLLRTLSYKATIRMKKKRERGEKERKKRIGLNRLGLNRIVWMGIY